MENNEKNGEEQDQKNSNDAPMNENRFWQMYLAVIQQRLKKENEQINENS